ncbi:hypothetical protein P3T39_006467 [Kitasatospora sp. GP82]|nr:hypothetical protein [Kitasatospora sp. GP82]
MCPKKALGHLRGKFRTGQLPYIAGVLQNFALYVDTHALKPFGGTR